jgi:hypothetical protein
MTPDQDATIPTADQEAPTDPRPAWERVAYVWLEREIDAGQPVDPATLAREVSVAPGFARDLLRLLRGHRQRDPELAELRGRVVRDRIIDAYLRRELGAGGRLDPAELAAEVGTSPVVARQWLAGLRALHDSPQGLEVLREPVSHGHPTPAQLADLQAHFTAGGHQQTAVAGRLADPERLAVEVERRYWTRELRAGQRLQPRQLARELGGDQRQLSLQLAELRAGPATAAERIAQLWHAQQQDPGARPRSSSQLAWRLGVSDSYVRHVTWQLRTRHGQPPLAERLAATHQRLASHPHRSSGPTGSGTGAWTPPAARSTRSCSSPNPARSLRPRRLSRSAPAARSAAPAWSRHCTAPRPATTTPGSSPVPPARDRVALRGRAAMAQGTRFLHDRTAAEQELALANQHSKELGVSDRALRTAWQRHGLGLPPRPTATPTTPVLDPAFVALNRGLLPARERSVGELAAWVRREEEYATLGAEVVVELNSESRTRRPTTRAWAIIRRAHRAHQRTSDRQQRGERRQVDRASRTDRTGRSPAQVQEREVVGGAR